MAERSGFFDAHLVNGEYDRVYLAESFAKYFASFIGNGIFGGKSNELMVQQKPTADMSVRVLSGQAWINGYWYENDDELSLAVDVADGVLNRIDLIVLRWNNSERVIRLAVVKGIPASNPSAPVIQRNADFYDLKLAQIYVKAGATRLTQANITDTRLNSSVCGLVHGVVDQLDTTEFGAQLNSFIEQFINDNESWSNNFRIQSQNAVNTLLTNKTNEVDALITASQNKFNTLDTNAKAWLEDLKSSSNEEISNLVAELQALIDVSDAATINARITEAAGKITDLESQMQVAEENIEALKALFIEHDTYKGCYYRIVNGETEWINPPNMPGIEYKTTERWNGKPLYRKVFYTASLPNKSIVGIEIASSFDTVVSVEGFAVDSDNNMYYPFPIILNGLSPIAVIQFVEGDGGDGSLVAISTNEDLTWFKAYITVKYTKI